MKSKPLFVLLVKGFAGFYVPLSLLFGLGSLLNIVPATMNGRSYYGVQGLAIYVLLRWSGKAGQNRALSFLSDGHSSQTDQAAHL